MYAIFFYFSITDIKKILEFTDVLNMGFEKYFKIKYDGLSRTDVDKFLEEINEFGEIYGVGSINQSGPYNDVKVWKDSFYISTHISGTKLGDLEDEDEIEKLQRKFSEEMLEILPLLGVVSSFEENNFHISEIGEKNKDFIAFSYKKENGKIVFLEGLDHVDGFKREK